MKRSTKPRSAISCVVCSAALLGGPAVGWTFDTGVSDDRVSLPEGPGSLEGVGENVSVDPNMGLMRFSIPIRVPAGFAGVTPDLALRYSSSAGSGPTGMGWSMVHPSIERMTMRGVPRYDEDDIFVSGGGNELVRVSEQIAPSSPAIYRNRFEADFTRYLWHDRRGGTGGYWEVQYADGRVGYFGADAQGQAEPSAIEAGLDGTFKYHLVEMADVYDHRIRYAYVKDGATSLVSEISYVFTGGSPTYQVQLSYEDRPDFVSDAKPGFELLLSKRLTGLRVLVRGQQLRRYALTYQADATTGRRSRLERVQTFGSGNELYPIVFSFAYSRGLGAQCQSADCGRPLLVEMVGEEGLGVGFGSGTANLVDINGDALPDLIDAASTRASHRFFINELGSDGSHTFSAPRDSATGDVSTFPLGSPFVQFLDFNGDGFTDLVSGGVADQKVVLNRGNGDWSTVQDLPGSAAWSGVDAELRFMDYDNDMDIDLVRSTDTQSFVFENDGSFDFTRVDLEPIGVSFASNVQFTDMNGDGLLDIVRLQANQLLYKLNFGRGRFESTFTAVPHPFDAGKIAQALVEDLDSDGYADIVVVSGNTVEYTLSRNGEAFEPVRALSEAEGRALPNREVTTTVLAADMNGNGSVDVVWVGGASGSVTYLDLFPVRSHLLTRIENGLGRVTDIAYQPSVEQRALSAEEGQPWLHPLPYPMIVVARTDEFDLLTDVHDVVEYRYRDGFYDGRERQFRGYAEVEQISPGDISQEEGRELTRYDVGLSEPHMNGKLLFRLRETGRKPVDEMTISYGSSADCAVAEVPSNSRLAQLGRREIGFPCEVGRNTLVKEGASAEAWVETRMSMAYGDGYGNVTRRSDEGVVSVGGGSCAPCSRPDGVFGQPCGNQCLGDEAFVESTFVSVDATNGRWLLNKVAEERRSGVDGGAPYFAEDIYLYDGDGFIGLPEGQLTQGKLSRKLSRVEDGKQIEVTRQSFDRHGNAIDVLDPLGSPGGDQHRRTYAYDEDGLRLVQVDVLNRDDAGPYRLRRQMQYDLLFDKVTLSSEWILVEGESAVTSSDPTAYSYDAFGRTSSMLKPGGDSGASPTFEFEYDLGNPTSRIITRRRSEVGGPTDIETIRCVDGRGRPYQTRRRTSDGEYTVDGFSIFNIRSQLVRSFQSYNSSSSSCDIAPPDGTRFTSFRYDGVNRPVETLLPDSDAPGGASVERTVYEPLRRLSFDGEDSDPASPFSDTPEVRTMDGLGRLVSLERRLVGDSAVTLVEYDGLGHPAGYVDTEGNRKSQVHDAMGRLLEIDDPNSGRTTFEYDDASNVVLRTDARGISTAYSYDGVNRVVNKFDPVDRDSTLITTAYDRSADCALTRCPNTAGRKVLSTYPGGADFVGYDVRRRPFSLVRIIEGQNYTLQSRYDNADRLVERIYPDGRSLNYGYDDASRLVSVAGVIDQVSYNSEGLIDSWTRANGAVDERSYDQRLRLEGVNVRGGDGSTLQEVILTRDRASNVVAVEDLVSEAMRPRTTYALDAWYRAIEARRGDRVEALAYDRLDNVVQRGELAFEYQGRPGAPTTVGGAAVSYDETGCVLSGGGIDNTWDFMGRLVRTDDLQSIYGEDHLRVSRRHQGEVTHYVAPDFEVRDGISVIYPRVGRSRVARLESSGYARAWLTGGVEDGDQDVVTAGEAFLRSVSGEDADPWLLASARTMLVEGRPEVVHLHRDELGSVVLATGDQSQVLGRRSFGLYGSDEGSLGYVDRYGFTGQEHEPTGLVRFPFRFLSTETGQWLSPDPAFAAMNDGASKRLPEAVSRYSYVMNNPGTNVDPDGLKTKSAKPSRATRVKRFAGRQFTKLRNRLRKTFMPKAHAKRQRRLAQQAEFNAFRDHIRAEAMRNPIGGRRRASSTASLERWPSLVTYRSSVSSDRVSIPRPPSVEVNTQRDSFAAHNRTFRVTSADLRALQDAFRGN